MIPESIKRLANHINPYLHKITDKYSDIEAIWLFGSRANGDHNQNSDWDLFVFVNDRVLDLLKADTELKNESEKNNIDLLVVFDGDEFKSPWKRPGEEINPYKKGCLAGVHNFDWKTISEVEANYTARKNDEVQIRKAWRIWP
jgi:predicted nucleotidyltransferase